ncbi:putative metal-dependent enzyme (double-stranded beta helix superfamily) [Tamaricihabitans halophyticus]|uniref:Putative metal-dependent enzyme (Double-stranded beta helix superfamily) n=1 Tax=Tamaricihabitans halophyticus TaxID=1262583 RepID=A0A4V2SSU4_9PSEU|nr:hypothetical protein [Tamaricihabitans halophyticus]TCP47826.1 putative metal-dependent enzyme (double-stranded beta helix superfamily) [Tamaricihabitans halophyticus]
MLSASVAEVHDFALTVRALVDHYPNERDVTASIADTLAELLADKAFTLPASHITAHPDHYVMYPLYVAPDGAFSIASAVWNVGQRTPVHGHETWGVVGIYSGVEREVRYAKPADGVVPERLGEHDWSPGEVTVCCTTDDDVHAVSCAGDLPCVGIHVYGANIGELRRRSYDADTGDVAWFVSPWATPATS